MRIMWIRSAAWRQAQALLRGESVPSTQCQEMTAADLLALPADLRAQFVRDGDVCDRGEFVSVAHAGQVACARFTADADVLTIAEIGEMVRRAMADATEQAKRAAATAAIEAAIAETYERELLAWIAGEGSDPADRPGMSCRTKHEIRKKHSVEIDARAAAEKAARDATLAAEDSARRSQLDAAVARLGTPSQRERWQAGVMPVGEAIGLITAEALAPLRAVAKIWYLVVSDAGDYHVGECGCDREDTTHQRDIQTLTDDQWVWLQRARAALPEGATVTYHRDDTSCPECGEKRQGPVYAAVSWMVGHIRVDADVLLDPVETAAV